MATSEHVIMQNEALIALAIASAIDIGTVQPFTILYLYYGTISCKTLYDNGLSSSCSPYVFSYVYVNPDMVEEPFSHADLLSTLKKMLDDPVGAVEVKFSTLGLICSLANSSE